MERQPYYSRLQLGPWSTLRTKVCTRHITGICYFPHLVFSDIPFRLVQVCRTDSPDPFLASRANQRNALALYRPPRSWRVHLHSRLQYHSTGCVGRNVSPPLAKFGVPPDHRSAKSLFNRNRARRRCSKGPTGREPPPESAHIHRGEPG